MLERFDKCSSEKQSFSQQRGCSVDKCLLVPVKAFEGSGDLAVLVEDVSFDFVAVDQRFDEVDAQLKIATKSVEMVNGPEDSMAGMKAYAAVLSISAQSLG